MLTVRAAAVLCGMAAFTLAMQATASGAEGLMDFYATVTAVREAPAGSPLPGLHLEAKVDGRTTDIYLAPVNFLEEYGMTFQKGDDVHIVGSRTKVAGADVVLAREVAVGAANRKTLYLRDDHGPFWTEEIRSERR